MKTTSKLGGFIRHIALALFIGTMLASPPGSAKETSKAPGQAVASLTPLMAAAESGDIAKVQALLAANADVNAKETTNGATALFYASLKGHVDVVQALLAANADVNAINTNGRTALSLATQQGHADVVKLLEKAR